MSTTVNEATTVELLDGTSITVRPLKISLLREFMKKFDEISEVAEDNEKSLALLVECVKIALKQYEPKLLEKETDLEEILNLPMVYKIINEASGIDLSGTSLLGNI
jgi:inhibitor of KinA sporulation pathway (predicted exonuclease)